MQIVNDFNRDKFGNRVMPIYKTDVWLDGKWIASSVGWNKEDTEAHAIKRAKETLALKG